MNREHCPIAKALDALDELPEGKRPAAYRLMLMILVKRMKPRCTVENHRGAARHVLQSVGLRLEQIDYDDDYGTEVASLHPVIRRETLEAIERNGLDPAVERARAIVGSGALYPDLVATVASDLVSLPETLRELIELDDSL